MSDNYLAIGICLGISIGIGVGSGAKDEVTCTVEDIAEFSEQTAEVAKYAPDKQAVILQTDDGCALEFVPE